MSQRSSPISIRNKSPNRNGSPSRPSPKNVSPQIGAPPVTAPRVTTPQVSSSPQVTPVIKATPPPSPLPKPLISNRSTNIMENNAVSATKRSALTASHSFRLPSPEPSVASPRVAESPKGKTVILTLS